MTDTLTALDATFLELEQLDDGALMSIGGTMVFEPLPDGGVPSIEDVRANLAARLGELPRYSQRLSSARTGGFSWPHWEADERFDIRNHVGHAALPAPGNEAQLCDWTADFFSHRLDRTRPLWELVLLEGLERGRWALGWKTHHCLVDGVGSVDVVNLMLDSEPSPLGHGTDPASANGRSLRSRLPRPPAAIVQAAQAGVQAASAGLHAAQHPKDALERSRALAEMIVHDQLIGSPQTSLDVPIGQTRRFAVVHIPLAELKAIRHELVGSVNDVVLAACTTGLRRLLLKRGEELPPRGLRAMVPMSIRDESGRFALGNRVTSLFVDLPVAEADARTRLKEITASTLRLKSSSAAEGPTTLLDLAALAPPVVLHAALARTQFTTRLFNVTITNVPGSQRPLYAFGSVLREIYPVVPLAARHSVGIAVFSYNGLVTFGISADCESTPDLEALADGIDGGLQELRALVPELQKVDEETRL
jgi:diacylglycerol O-acyltransferase / wax synthase